ESPADRSLVRRVRMTPPDRGDALVDPAQYPSERAESPPRRAADPDEKTRPRALGPELPPQRQEQRQAKRCQQRMERPDEVSDDAAVEDRVGHAPGPLLAVAREHAALVVSVVREADFPPCLCARLDQRQDPLASLPTDPIDVGDGQ